MNCPECRAFLINFDLATKLYAEATKALFGMVGVRDLDSPEFQRQKKAAMAARYECLMAKEALHIHQESHAA